MMRTFKVTLFGHSYIRDLRNLENKQLVVDHSYDVHLRYLFKPGATIAHYFSNEEAYEGLFTDSPDVIFVFLGGNDLRVDWDIHDTIFKYKTLIERIASRLPNTAIICAYIEPRFARANPRFCSPEPSEYKALARKFNNWLQRWKVPYRKFLTWGSNRFENPNLFKPDLIHLNENGLIVFWNLFEDLLIKVIESFFVQ